MASILAKPLFIFCFITYSCVAHKSNVKEMKIRMPKIQTYKNDSYICLATSVEDLDAELVGYKIDAAFGIAHHVSFAVCENVSSDKRTWDCRKEQGSLCMGRAINVGDWNQWANYKGDTFFTNDVGIHLGSSEKFNNVLLQVHFKSKQPRPELQDTNAANLTLYLANEKRQFTRQMLVFASTGYIPGNSENFSSEMVLVWKGIPVIAVKYFVHTHDHGKLVEGYVIQNGKAILLGRAAPQGEHRDKRDLLSGPVTIRPGEILAARCIFDNKSPKPVQFGMTGNDEMCNFYLDFKYDSRRANVYEKALLAQNDAQSHSWCSDKIPGVNLLCNL